MHADPHAHPLRALTGLRFFAALHVLLYHAYLGTQPDPGAPPAWCRAAPAWVHHVLSCGYTSVSLFFVLSGFILAYRYLDGGDRPIDRGRFWFARFARIYPVYLLGLAVSAPFFFDSVAVQCADPSGAAFTTTLVGGATLSLVHAWVPRWACWWNCPGWSLSVEAFFYLLFPWIGGRIVRLEPRRLVACMALCWPLALAAPVAAVYGLELRDPMSMLARAVMHDPLLRLPEFVMGVALGRWYLVRRGAAGARRLGRWTSLPAALALVCALACSPYVPWPILHNGLLAPLYAWLIYALATESGPLARLLSRPGAVLLGEASYALYILHLPLWRWAGRLAEADGLEPSRPGFILGYGALSVGLSVGVFMMLEDPARRGLRRLYERWRARATGQEVGVAP